ncbi:hypothetical protein PsYK624_053310 [Phanerochaete sordida]|uniref:Uncharacterized protein n=1 Tax=Phanerochaete sordida TaxID=48140 RepID=A0A9P3G864_9APHY|nr:hypothetical protein PsYK624_053310 [Phanerochaete sordida]
MKYAPRSAFLDDFLRHLPLANVRVAQLQELSPARLSWGEVLPLLLAVEEVCIEAEPPSSADEPWLADADVILGRPGSIFPSLVAATISYPASPRGPARCESNLSALRILAYHLRTQPESFAQGRPVAVQTIPEDYREAMSQPKGAALPMIHSV